MLPTTTFDRYVSEMDKLLARRAESGELSQEEEAERAQSLDDLYWQLETYQQAELERRYSTFSASAPPESVVD